MSPILIDINAYAAFKRGHPDALAIVAQAPEIGICAVVLGELYGGFAAGTREEANRGELAEFLSFSQVTVLPVDLNTASIYANIYLQLRLAGTPLPTNDMWIAACAVQHGLHVFSFDKHFRSVPGLLVGSLPAEFGLAGESTED